MSTRKTLLEELAPGVRSLPFVSLAKVPTPVERLESVGPRVYAKRDDLISDVYGGNKVRRYELLLGEAIAKGHKKILTLGGIASTQVTATAKLARALGLASRAVLFSQPATPYLREALATTHEAGMELVQGGPIPIAAYRFFRELAQQKDAYVIMPGASGALANLGYVDAALELGQQVEAGLLPRPDRIVLPCGSGGTLAGLVIGLGLLGWPTIVTGVRIAERAVVNRTTLGYRVSTTARLLARLGGPRPSRKRSARFEIDPRFLGAGYGAWSPAAARGAARIRDLFGVPGEVTYSGKTMAALGRIAHEHPDENVLFWCTLSATGRNLAADAAVPAWAAPLVEKAERSRPG